MSRGNLLPSICISALLMLGFAVPARADFTVNNLADDSDLDFGNTHDGICDADINAPVVCTLKAALQEANATPAHDTITFSVSGTHNTGTPTLQAAQPVTIDGNGNGTGPGDTLIVGNNMNRVLFANHGVGNGTVTLKDLRIQDGRVDPANDGGAGIRTNGDLTLNNVTVTSNDISGTGAGSGAGIQNTDSGAELEITGSTISDNTVGSTGNNAGGGISSAGPLTITNSVISGNDLLTGATAARGGGVAAVGSFSISSSTISGNSVAGTMDAQGGGIYGGSTPGTRSITNTTITGNIGTSNGSAGVHLTENATITNATFANNSDGGAGAGDDLEQQTGATAVQNSIFASDDPCEETGGGDIAQVFPGHNIDVGTTCAFGDGDGNMDDTDPVLTGATLFGGGQLIHIPLASPVLSPAIDNADPSCGGGLAFDQRGRERPQGGASNCDIGAYERDYRDVNVTVNGSGSVTGTGVNCSTGTTGDCVHEFLDDSPPFVLTAIPASGFEFGSWAGCAGTSGNQCTVNTGNNQMVTATFNAVPSPGGGSADTNTNTATPTKKCKKGRKLKKGKCVKKKRKK